MGQIHVSIFEHTNVQGACSSLDIPQQHQIFFFPQTLLLSPFKYDPYFLVSYVTDLKQMEFVFLQQIQPIVHLSHYPQY